MDAISLLVSYRRNLREMRIVTLISGLNNGGAEKFAVELCNELSINHEVYLLVKNPIGDYMIPAKKVSNRVHLIEFNSTVKWDVLFFLKLIYQVFQLKPQVIHLHSSLLVFYTFFYPYVFRKCKVFHTIHNQVTPAYLKVLKLIRALGKSGRKLKQVVISEKIKQDYLAIFPQISFSVVENGIKMMGHAARENKELVSPRKKLLAIGHFGPAKRFDALVDTLGLAEVSMKYSLAIIGEEKGEYRPVTKYILSKALENVVLLGLKENVQDYLKDADALIIWSSFEGMPLVMLEALSVGCPIISTPVGGIPDVIVTGVNGILTTGLEQVDLVNALNQFYELTAVELDNIRKNNQELFKDRFSIESCAKNYECLFSVKE